MSHRRLPTCGLEPDTRAVSTQVGYVLAIAIIALLMAGLITSTSGVVTQTTDQGTRAELQIIGDRIAAQVMAADRILTADTETTMLMLDANVPARAGQESYALSSTGSTLVLESTATEISVTIPLQTEHAVSVESAQATEWRIYSEGETITIGPATEAPR